VSTGVAQRVNLQPDGSFNTTLAPGTYRVEIERDGRRQPASRNLEIVSGSSQVTLQVELGPASEVVEVQAQAPALQDEPSDVGRGYTTRTVRSLPVFDRNYQEITGLATGVTPPSVFTDRINDPQQSRAYNANGLPAFATTTFWMAFRFGNPSPASPPFGYCRTRRSSSSTSAPATTLRIRDSLRARFRML